MAFPSIRRDAARFLSANKCLELAGSRRWLVSSAIGRCCGLCSHELRLIMGYLKTISHAITVRLTLVFMSITPSLFLVSYGEEGGPGIHMSRREVHRANGIITGWWRALWRDFFCGAIENRGAKKSYVIHVLHCTQPNQNTLALRMPMDIVQEGVITRFLVGFQIPASLY